HSGTNKGISRYSVYDLNRTDENGNPITGCCAKPVSCSRFHDGECWYFAANDPRQRTANGYYDPSQGLAVAPRPVTSKDRDSEGTLRKHAVDFSMSALQ